MTQTTTERMKRWHGPSDKYAVGFLDGRDWILQEDFSWTHVKDSTAPAPREADAMKFLIEEWDYKGWNF